jgi:hypothetical protein
METTESTRELRQDHLEAELAEMVAHINAATARCLELALEFRKEGGAACDDFAAWVAFRCGISTREAREFVRVAEALDELPAIRAAFARGELTFTKVRALTRVANERSEQALLELAGALTASQLERALRAYRRVTCEEARASHELEYVDYYWDEDGSLVLRARLAAEDGTLVIRALDAARERVRERRREQQAAESEVENAAVEAAHDFELPRSPSVEAIVELAERALAWPVEETPSERPRVVVHVDAATLAADGGGRTELEEGPVIAPETARRLVCDAETVTAIEREGLSLSVGRTRRTVPPKLRRVLEERDDGRCRWPGCERRRHLAAHHRTHWAQGGETSVDNLLLLCFHHHRLVHEGGYRIEDGPNGEPRFRNRHGVLCPSVPRSPPGSPDALVAANEGASVTVSDRTNRNGYGDRLGLADAVDALIGVIDSADDEHVVERADTH